jgi:DNA-binding response OmpR family regulator
MTKVLVVEDEPKVLQIMRYHFASAGLEGVYAPDADEGWRMLVTETPDVVVMDLQTDGGWPLVERIRGDGRFSTSPVILLSRNLEQETIDKATKLRCEYLSKQPLVATALLNKVKAVVKQAEEGRGRGGPPPPPGADPRHIQLVEVGVVILMDAYRIEGNVHLPPEVSRFSDAWESIVRDQRSYFPVTDARVMTVDGDLVLATAAFIEVRKSDVRGVFPADIGAP